MIGYRKQLLNCQRNYTGPSQSLTYNTVNECHAINWDTIGSIWLPDSKYRNGTAILKIANLLSLQRRCLHIHRKAR